ncbi:hypothetical protein VPH35_027334 [Triticum aestivum]
MPRQLLLGRGRQSGLSSPRRRRRLTSLPTSSSPSCHGCRPSPCSASRPSARPGGPCYPTQVSSPPTSSAPRRSARRCSRCPARTTPTTSRRTTTTAPSTCPSTGTAPAAPRNCCTGRSCPEGSPWSSSPCRSGSRSTACAYTFPRAGLGFDPRSKRYKVARFFYEAVDSDDCLACRFEVLTLGTGDITWRQTADPPYWICGRTPAHVNGHIYWTCGGMPARPDPPDHLADEEFSPVPFPPSGFRPARLAELGGELCCVCFGYTNRELEVWSLGFDGGADGKPEWSRRWATVIDPDLVTELAECRALRPPRVVLHEGAWLLTEERNVHRYDDRTGEIEKISSGVPDARYHYRRREKEVVLHLTNYVESLVRIT